MLSQCQQLCSAVLAFLAGDRAQCGQLDPDHLQRVVEPACQFGSIQELRFQLGLFVGGGGGRLWLGWRGRCGGAGAAQLAEHADVVQRAAVAATHHADRQPLGLGFAVFQTIPDLPLPLPGGFDLCPHRREELGVMVAGVEQGRRMADRFLAAVAGQCGEGRVDRQDALCAVGDQKCLAEAVEGRGGHPGLSRQQWPVRQVVHQRQRFAVGAAEREDQHLGLEGLAVGPAQRPHAAFNLLAGLPGTAQRVERQADQFCGWIAIGLAGSGIRVADQAAGRIAQQAGQRAVSKGLAEAMILPGVGRCGQGGLSG